MLTKIILGFVMVAVVLMCGCTNYDVDTPDTPANRKAIERHLKVKPSSAISHVYYYADELGVDVHYQISFKCEKATIDRIIASLSLTPAPVDYKSLPARDDLTWWKPDSTKGRACWVKEKKNEYYWELWYSEEDGIAFYQEISV